MADPGLIAGVFYVREINFAKNLDSTVQQHYLSDTNNPQT